MVFSRRLAWETRAHLRHDFDLLIPPLEGQGEDLGPPVGHRRRLAVNHQVRPVGLRGGWLRVLLRTDHVQGLRANGQGERRAATRRPISGLLPAPQMLRLPRTPVLANPSNQGKERAVQCGEKNKNFRAIPEPPASYPCSPPRTSSCYLPLPPVISPLSLWLKNAK